MARKEIPASPLKRQFRLWFASFVLVCYIVFHVLVPNVERIGSMQGSYTILLFVVLGIFIVFDVIGLFVEPLGRRMIYWSYFCGGVFIVLGIYEAVTLKAALLPLPYFPSPPKIFEAFVSDGGELFVHFLSSIRLLLIGYVIGTAVGIVNGVAMGVFRGVYYWVNPIFRFIGPVPAVALVPVAMILAPTSYMAAVFIIAFAVWYPVTVMVWSAITEIDQKYFEVARTLGGGRSFEMLHVVLPAIAPSVFFGMYMGFCYSFATLIVAEMLGVGSGLGFYMQSQMDWSAYYAMYAALLLIAVLCSGMIWLLFRIRGLVLRWSEETAL